MKLGAFSVSLAVKDIAISKAFYQNLGFEVIAEGVETEAQLEHLRAMQCQYAQGYYFSRPLECDLITRFIERLPR